jgi:hypothetical protein
MKKNLLFTLISALFLSGCVQPIPTEVFSVDGTELSLTKVYDGDKLTAISASLGVNSNYGWTTAVSSFLTNMGATGGKLQIQLKIDEFLTALESNPGQFPSDPVLGYHVGTITLRNSAGTVITVPVYYIPTIRVTYDLNGGSGNAPATQDGDFGATITLPDGSSMTPPDNHIFYGWYNQASYQTIEGLYRAGDDLTLTQDIKLYALWSGNGTSQANPLLISTQEELAGINNSNTTLGRHYKLIANISLTYTGDETWTPIGGNGRNSFSGSFDGNGHSISNLKVNVPGGNVGLFGTTIGSATIISNLHVDIAADGVCGQNAGGIVGSMTSSGATIEGCTVTGGPVTASFAGAGYTSAGGIVGTTSVATIRNCLVTAGPISATHLTGAQSLDNSNAGGIVGFNNGGANSTIQSCVSMATVSASNGNQSYCGGIAGAINNCTLKDCYAMGELSVSSENKTRRIGGITGYANTNSTVQNCYATAIVNSTGIAASSNYVGGIVGQSSGSRINCVALSPSISGDGSSIHRITGTGSNDANNYANQNMLHGTNPGNWTSNLNGNDGANCSAKPEASWWTNPATWNTNDGDAWDFSSTWIMGPEGYPILRNINYDILK